MNKRAVIKFGTLSFLVLTIVLIIIFSSNSSAISKKDQYILGENIKLDFRDYENYKLKITTPTSSILKSGSRDIFAFTAEETGSYSIELKQNGKSEFFELEVIANPASGESPKAVENGGFLEENFPVKNLTKGKSKEENISNSTKKYQVVAGEPVLKLEKIKSKNEELKYKIPKEGENIIVSNNGEEISYTVKEGLPILNILSEEKEIVLEAKEGEVEIEYYTKGPVLKEKIISELEKEVEVSSDLHYENVLSYTSISEELKLKEKSQIGIYWKEEKKYLNFEAIDENQNGIIDKIEWIVPHLSTQTFEIIIITKAEHLDEERLFIEGIYDKVKAQDNIWQTIPENHYVRATFERLLSKQNDITIYARSNQETSIEVYEKDSTEKIATFKSIQEEGKYRVILENLSSRQDTFDLKIIGGEIEFDYIVDPTVNVTMLSDDFENGNFNFWDDNEATDWDLSTSQSVSSSHSAHAGSTDNNLASDDLDMSDATGIYISFYYWDNNIDNNDNAYVRYWDGGAYDDIYDLGNDAEEQWNFYSDYITDSQYFVSDFHIDFEASSLDGGGGGENLYIDDVIIIKSYFDNPPSDPNPSINSSDGTNFTTKDLNCFDTLSDPEGGDMNVSVRWYMNGSLYSTYDYNNSYSDGTDFSSTLLSGNTSIGDAWTCSMRLFDGLDYSSWQNSSSLTVTEEVIYGALSISLIDPTSNQNVTQNEFFNFTVQVDCSGGPCGDVNVTLDPIEASEVLDYETAVDGSSISHTAPLGDNRMVVAFVTADSSTSSVTIGGSAATLIAENTGISNNMASAWYRIIGNGSGENMNVVATTGNNPTVSVVTLGSVNQTSPIHNYSATDSSSGPAPSPVIEVTEGGRALYIQNSNQGNGVDDTFTPPTNGGTWTELFDFGAASNRVTAGYRDSTNETSSLTVDTTDTNGANRGSMVAFSTNPIVTADVESKGTIPMNSGTPFYTISQNPTDPTNNSCLSGMTDGDSCNITWIVNATGDIDSTYDFFAYANSTDYPIFVPSVETSHINITISSPPPSIIGLEVLYPTGNLDVYQNELFNVTVNLTCIFKDCGTVNVTLDPIVESFEDFETGTGGFTSSQYSGGVNDWHRSSESSNDGSYAFKAGDTGAGTYSSDANSYLQTPVYDISSNSTFQFYQYLYSETAYDGGKLEYSLDGGSWTKVTSFNSGGYTGNFNNWNSIAGFTDTETVWDGTIGSAGTFSLVDVNMTPFASGNNITFRWRFASDTNTEYEGWYIDSVNFTTTTPGGTKGTIPMNSGTPFYTTTQNPFTSNSLSEGESQTIVFTINATGGLNEVYEFFAYANQTSNPTTSSITSSWNVTIRERTSPVNLTINYPTGTFPDVTPLLNLTVEGTAHTIWYNLNNSANTTICTSCSSIPEFFLHQPEGSYLLNVYANNSGGNTTHASETFTIDMNYNYYDTFQDSSGIDSYSYSSWEVGQINFSQEFIGSAASAWDALTQTGDSAWSNSGRSDYSFRMIVDATYINQSGDQARFEFISADGPLGINNPTVCERDGSTSNCVAGTWINLTIQGSQNYIIPTGETRFTDWAEIAIDPSKDYLVTYYLDSTNDGVGYLDPAANYLYSISGADYSLTEDWSGLSPTAENLFYGFLSMQVRNETYSNPYVISKEINVTDTIAEFVNITWTESGDPNLSISLNVSANNGATWHTATKDQGLVSISAGNSLIYKVFADSPYEGNISLLDLNITWTNVASPAPDVTINYPTSSTFPDVTPVLNFSVTNGLANTAWYTINGGSPQVVCTNCNGEFTDVLYLQEGSYIVAAYTNNSLGAQKSDSVSFTVDMEGNYFDTYLDDSQTWTMNGPWWLYGNVTYSDPTGGVILNETFDSAAVLSDWTMSTGTWDVQNQKLIKTDNVADSIVVYNDLDLEAGKNYNISMTYSNVDDDESGIIFRYIDDNNFYKCTFHDLDGADPTTNNEGLTMWEGGVATVFDNGNYDLSDANNTILVSIQEDNISCYLNGVLAYNVFDSSWDGGKVGVYNHYDNNVEYDDYLIMTWEDSLPSFISYPITTLQNIVEILDVTWNSYLENSENNITVDISTDGGSNWHEATNGAGLGTIEVDNDLVYRVNYKTASTSIASLLDLNITWSHSASPAPTITVTDPGAVIADTTPILNASIDGPANTFWYTVDSGSPQIICTTCSAGSYDVLILLEEADYDIDFYANNSIGSTSTEEVSFEVNMNRNYFDTFLDSSQIRDAGDTTWQYGNITFFPSGMGTFEGFETGSFSSDWTTTSTANGRIQVATTSAHSGAYSIIMDSSTSGGTTDLNQLITTKDFSGATEVILDFWYRDWGDETNTASDHTGTQNSDGVFYTCDGSQWYMIYDLDPASLSDGTWQNVNINITADPDFCATVTSNFAIKLTQYDNYPLIDDGIAFDDINISIPGGKASTVAHAINVSQIIRGISNITWNTAGEDVDNQITVELSVDSGTSWFSVTSGSSYSSFTPNSSLVYRVNFSATGQTIMSLLDMNISWEEPPSINILYPENNYVYNSPITKMNYTIAVSGSETLDSCWFTNDSGTTNYSVTCGSDVSTLSTDGVNIWTLFANDSSGALGSDTVQFIIDTSAPTIVFLNQTPDPIDENSDLEIFVNVTDSNIDKVWIIIWESIIGGATKFTGFLSNIFGDTFNVEIPIDTTYNLAHNYTIYANDTTSLETNYSGNFTVLKAFFALDDNPIYADGITQAIVSGYLGLTSGADLINHAFNIWLEGQIIPFENLTAHGTYLSSLNFTGQDSLFSGSLLQNVSDAGGYLTLTGTNTSGSMSGIMDAGARVDWGTVDWTLLSAPCSGTVNYYDGVSWGYDSTHDAYINSNSPTTNYGTDSSLREDTSPDVLRSLIKFEDIFGYGLNKIPYNSTISSAAMNVYVYDIGNAMTAYEILEDWDQSQVSYNGRLSGTSWSSAGLSSTPSRSLTSSGIITASSIGTKSLTITDLVRSWNNKSKDNYGLVLFPGGASETILRSSEYVTATERPSLDITFSSTSCGGIQVYTRTSNDQSTWTDWEELNIGDEINDSLGYSRYLEYNVVFGSFNGTIKPNLWDIEFNYTATVTDALGEFNYSFNTTSVFGTYDMNFTSGIRTIFTYEEAELRVQSGIDPVAELLTPSNDSISSTADVTIEYNATDENDDLAYSVLFVDGTNVSYNESEMTNGLNEFEYTFTEGIHTFYVQVFDSSGLNDTTETRTITIDLTSPNVSLLYPDNESSFTVGYLNLSFLPTDNLAQNLTCNVTLDGTNIAENTEFENNTQSKVTTPALTDGLHYWNVTCIDESLRSFTSETRQFNISDTPPTVTLLSPPNNTVENSQDVNFTFFPADNSGITICELSIDGTYSGNVTNPQLSKNATILATGLSQGFHNWSVSCTDLSSSTTSSENWTVGIDTQGPTIEIFNPANNSISTNATPSFDIRITDAIDSLLSCELLVDSVSHESFNATSASRFNFTTSVPMQDGIRSWQINCTDDSGFSNISAARNLDIKESPTVTLNNQNDSHISSTSLSVFYVPSDNTNVASCTLYLNGIANESAASPTEDSENLLEPTSLPNGIYWYYVNCSDDNGNIGLSPEYVATLDTVAPTPILHFPLNEPVYATNITFNFTAIDSLSDQINCSLTVDNIEEASEIIFTNFTNQSIELSTITDGTHLWNITCEDLAGNTNTSTTYNFTRFTAPGVSLVSPENATWLNDSNVEFIYFPQDDEGFSKSELFLNGGFDSENATPVTSGANNSFIKSLSDGIYTWYVRVTDISLTPTDSETRTVYVDTAAPAITLGLPAQDNIYDTNNVTFNFSITDNLDPSVTCDLYLDSDLEWTGSPTNATEEIVNLLLIDGNYTYSINCTDHAGNGATSTETNFSVFAPPKINLTSPAAGIFTDNTTINFSYIPIDALGLLNCSIFIDSTREDSSSSIVANVENNFTVSGVLEGAHNWSIECVDTDENLNVSQNRTFYVDLTAPTINLTAPENNSDLDANFQVLFNWTATDALDNLLTCDLVVDGNVEDSSFATSGFPRSEGVSGLSEGTHYWNVTCSDQVGNSNTSETLSFNYTRPDFLINETLISISNENPTENESLTINATVYNLGGASASSVNVKFYNGDPDTTGVEIGSTTISVQGFSSNITSITWDAPLGASNIFVEVDTPLATNGSYQESNESNNRANKTFSVLSWHFFYGTINTNTTFTLTDSSSYEIANWDLSNLTKANIYVADYDSIVEWQSLQAIGKTTSGTDSSSDIQELDTALSMTSFKDSHEALYLNSSSEINETRSYTVFRRTIDEVPVVNSINSSNFKTGILWDTDDDTNSEYDATEKEDIVYVTSIQKSTLGSFEVADYELRVPAKLREYDPANQNTAVFYMEII